MTGIEKSRFDAIRWILAGSILLSCLGYLIKTLRYSDKVFTVLWNEHYLNWSEDWALRVSEWGAICMVLAAVVGSFYRFRGAQVLVFLWLLITVYCGFITEYWHPEYIWGASAIRMFSPLLLLFLLSSDGKLHVGSNRLKALEWGMRICIALVFFFHGHECLANKALFLDFIQSVVRLFGMDGISTASAQTVLRLIGIMDVLVAVSMLIPARLYVIAFWVSFWGLATGFVRIIFAGWMSYPEFLLRIIHGALPLCLVLIWLSLDKAKNDLKEKDIA